MNNLVDQFTSTLKTLREPIDVVMKAPPGPKRWRLAHDLLWLNLSWKNQKIYQEVVKENELVRGMVNKFGQDPSATKAEKSNKSLRNYLNIPIGAYQAIEKADPNVFRDKSNAKKFFETFKEYSTREVF